MEESGPTFASFNWNQVKVDSHLIIIPAGFPLPPMPFETTSCLAQMLIAQAKLILPFPVSDSFFFN